MGSNVDSLIRKNLVLSMLIDASADKREMSINHSLGVATRKVKIIDEKLKYDNRCKDGFLSVKNIQISITPDEDIKLYKVYSKILLGFIAYFYGAEEALNSKFDSLRKYILSNDEHATALEFKQLTTIFHRNKTLEKINKISFFGDIEIIPIDKTKLASDHKYQTKLKTKTLDVPNYPINKNEICNFISISNTVDNSVVASVTLLEKKSCMITIKNCTIPRDTIYFHKFSKKY